MFDDAIEVAIAIVAVMKRQISLERVIKRKDRGRNEGESFF